MDVRVVILPRRPFHQISYQDVILQMVGKVIVEYGVVVCITHLFKTFLFTITSLPLARLRVVSWLTNVMNLALASFPSPA